MQTPECQVHPSHPVLPQPPCAGNQKGQQDLEEAMPVGLAGEQLSWKCRVAVGGFSLGMLLLMLV